MTKEEKIDHIYHVLIADICMARQEGRIPDTAKAVANMRKGVKRELKTGRFSEREAKEINEVITIAYCRVKQQQGRI